MSRDIECCDRRIRSQTSVLPVASTKQAYNQNMQPVYVPIAEEVPFSDGLPLILGSSFRISREQL